MQEQGFEQLVIAGENLQAPPLLSCQSVVIGISDGNIQLPRRTGRGIAAKKAASKAMTAGTQRQQLSSTIARPAKVLIKLQYHHIRLHEQSYPSVSLTGRRQGVHPLEVTQCMKQVSGSLLQCRLLPLGNFRTYCML